MSSWGQLEPVVKPFDRGTFSASPGHGPCPYHHVVVAAGEELFLVLNRQRPRAIGYACKLPVECH